MNRKERRAKGTGKDGTQRPNLQSALGIAMQCLRQGRHGEAEMVYRDVIGQAPSCQPALFNLGLLAHRRGALGEAADFFEKLIQLNPQEADATMALAILRAEQRNADEAHRLAERALELGPSAAGLVQLGALFSETGDNDKARECLSEAIRQQPGNIKAHFTLHTLKKYTAGDPDFLQLLDIHQKSSQLSVEERALLSFMLGKACLDQGNAESAFGHLAEGNRLRRAVYKQYDISAQEKYVDSIIRLFDKETVERLRGKSPADSPRPVFVIGMMRSGSTLVDQILSSHPDVESCGELPLLTRSLPVFANAEFPGKFGPREPSMNAGLLAKLDPAMLQDIGQKYLSLTGPFAKDAKRVVDKMLFNYLWTGVIRLALPNAKIIHCTRDPADIGLSIWGIMFAEHMPWAYDQKEIGRYYRAYKKLMDHWNELFPGEIYEVNYETMIAGQENQTRRLLEYCGLPWDDRCLKFHETSRRVQTSSLAQVRQPIYKDSVKKWQKYAQYLTDLTGALEGKP